MKFAVIVDAYSTGAQLARKFHDEGVDTLHVQSCASVPDIFAGSFRPGDFVAGIVFADLASCLAEVARRYGDARPLCVLAGTETGVEIADLLAQAWDLPGNPADSSRVRRDKYEMASALRAAGLATPAFVRTGVLAELLAWARLQPSWPIVLKPLASAGNDNVFFCRSECELERAFHSTIGRVNRLGESNDQVLAQSFLVGIQYVVNSVSIDGCHYFSDLWLDRRKAVPGASNTYDCEELLAPQGPVQDVLLAYMRRALDALGVRNGPAHSEVMLTADGPVLIETGARLQGGMLEGPVIEAVGASQITLTVERYCHPEVFRRRLASPYVLARQVRCVALISEQSGIVADDGGLDHVRALASYSCHFHAPGPGDPISRTTDLFSIAGVVYLSHADGAVLEADYQTIRRLERQHALFAVREAAAA